MRYRRLCRAGSSIEDFALRCWRLFAAWWKRLGVQFVELAKPLFRIVDDWFKKHSLAHSPDAHAIALETKLTRQAYRLAAAVLEKLGDIRLRHTGKPQQQ